MAITHITREVLLGNFQLVDVKPMDSRRMLVVSLGTGIPKQEHKFTAEKASQWGLLNWVYDNGSTPLIDSFSDASSDMVDFHVSTLFKSFRSEKNYLRIQVWAIDYVILFKLKSVYHVTVTYIN